MKMDKQHNKESKEELRKLLERFYDQAEAQQAAEDIEAGERILRNYPVLEPAETVKWRIKATVGAALRQKRQRQSKRRVYQVLATAAVIIIMMAVSTKIIEKNSSTFPPEPTSGFIAMDTGAGGVMDAKAALLSDEVAQAERQFASIQFGQRSDEELNSVDELETEYITIASDFWKGE
jgi:hypothetical protein